MIHVAVQVLPLIGCPRCPYLQILDGHNIMDFVDPDIDAKLAELEREEEELEVRKGGREWSPGVCIKPFQQWAHVANFWQAIVEQVRSAATHDDLDVPAA